MSITGWCQDPGAAAALCKGRSPVEAAQTISIADDLLGNTFLFRGRWEMERTNIPVTFPDGNIGWEAVPAGDPEWVFAMNRHTCFVDLGRAYQTTGNAAYAAKFAALAEHWLRNVPFGESRKTTSWRSIETGLRVENWLKAWELFSGSPALTPALRGSMAESLSVHGQWLEEAHGSFQRLSNWGILEDHGLFLLGVFLDRPRWTSLALGRLAEEAEIQILGDGSHWEQSPLYHCEVLHCLLDTVAVAHRNGVALNADFESRVHRMAEALALWCKPDGRIACQSDSDDIDARDLLARAALLFGDGGLKWFAGDALPGEALWSLGARADAQYGALPSIPPESASAALPDSGNYMLRGGLGRDAPWLHFRCGCLGSGHGHADLLHIDLTAHGEDILIDSGRYTYVDGPLRRALKSPAAHNTTRVDGVDFSVPIGSWGYGDMAAPVKGPYRFTPRADYVEGAHLGYLGLPGGGVLAGRQVVFIKPDIWVIFDAFYAAGEHHIEQFFHFGLTGRAERLGSHVDFTGERARARIVPLGDGLTLDMRREPASREYNRLEMGDCLCVSRETRGFGWFITVLSTGSRAEEPDIQASLVPVSLLKAGTLLPDEKAQAVRITKGEREVTVLVCHGEIISEVDLLAANGHAGYGKVLLFGDDLPINGLCLAW